MTHAEITLVINRANNSLAKVLRPVVKQMIPAMRRLLHAIGNQPPTWRHTLRQKQMARRKWRAR